MNCKPGDLAVIVDTQDPRWLKDIGRLVNILEPFGDGVSWFISPVDGRGFEMSGRVLQRMCEYDKNLRPIRDPGDDAQDETLQWLPVPSTKETA